MLNEGEKLLICRYIDEKLDRLRKIRNADIDLRTAVNYSDELYQENNEALIKEIHDLFHFDYNQIREFYLNPDFKFKTIIPSTYKETLGSCFFVARCQSLVKTVPTNPKLSQLSPKEQANYASLKTIIKTTRTILAYNQYFITERIVNVPESACNNTYRALFSVNLEKLNNDSALNVRPEDRYKLALANTERDYWMVFAKKSNNTIVNNTLFNSWEEYASLFKERFNDTINREDNNGNSLWIDEDMVMFDNRQSNTNHSSLEEQYKLTLK